MSHTGFAAPGRKDDEGILGIGGAAVQSVLIRGSIGSTRNGTPMKLRTLLVGTLVAGCVPSLGLPNGTMVECQDDSDCPSDTRCRSTLGVCVSVEAEQIPPGISDRSITPERASANTPVSITVTVDEPLGKPPLLSRISPSKKVVVPSPKPSQRERIGPYRRLPWAAAGWFAPRGMVSPASTT